MSIHADRGTAAHKVLERCLLDRWQLGLPTEPTTFVGAKIRIEDGPHAPLSPSGAKRWMNCSKAPEMEAAFPEPAQGPREVVFDDEDAAAVKLALDYVNDRVEDLRRGGWDVQVYAEAHVSPGPILGDDRCDGTSDVRLVVFNGDKDPIHIDHIDYKHGAGVPVMASDPQNDLYLLGSCAEMMKLDENGEPVDLLPTLKTARLTVIQPRCDKVEPRIRHREISDARQWLMDFSGQVAGAIWKVDNEPEFNPGEEICRFCSAKEQGPCKAYGTWSLREAGIVDEHMPQSMQGVRNAIDVFAGQDTRVLSPDQIVGIMDTREILTGMLASVEAWALQQLQSPQPPVALAERYKLVRGQSRRKWGQEEDETFKALGKIKFEDPETHKKRGLGKKDLYESRLVSVAGAEKKLKAVGLTKTGWAAFRRLVDKPEGALTIAPASDPRPAVVLRNQDPDEAFADVDQSTLKPAKTGES